MATYDSFAAPEQFRTNSDPAKDATSATAQRQPDGIGESPTNSNQPVSQDRQAGPRISDEQREAAITRAGLLVEHHMADLRAINNRDPHIFSDFADAAAARWKAQRARELMEQLIAGRSPEYVARLERERGLA